MQSQRLLVQLHWVWFSLQFGTKHPIDLGFILILLDESTTVTTMERDWDFGNVVCLYCHLFFFVFETVREEQCVYLSGVSVSHVGYLKSCVFLVAALAGLCARAFCISSYVSISHLCLLQGHWTPGVYLEHLVFILNTACLFWIPRIEDPTCGYTCLSSLLLYLQNSWS